MSRTADQRDVASEAIERREAAQDEFKAAIYGSGDFHVALMKIATAERDIAAHLPL